MGNPIKMKSKLGIIILILVVIIISIVIFYPRSRQPSENVGNNVESVSNVTTTGSIYDGTYTGAFNYEYRDWDQLNSKAITPWTSSSFTLTFALKTVGKSYSSNPDPYVYLSATNVISSDPGFGTGSGGVNATADFGGEQNAWLPENPAKQDGLDSFFEFVFPNNARIEIPVGRTLKEGGVITVKVSPDGKTLSSDPNWVSPFKDPDYGSWSAETPEGVLWKTTPAIAAHSNFVNRVYKFESWNLTKVSP